MYKGVRIHGGVDLVGKQPIVGLEIPTISAVTGPLNKGTLFLDHLGAAKIATEVNSVGAAIKSLAFLSDIPVAINGVDGGTLLVGIVDPVVNIGTNKDIYINTVTWDFFNKPTGTWSLLGNIKGVKGDQGVSGTKWYVADGLPGIGLGVQGDMYLNTTTGDHYTKSVGTWDFTGNIKGVNGLNGTSLLSDVIDPVLGVGNAGDTYLNVASGDTFSKATGVWVNNGNIKGTAGIDGGGTLLGVIDPTTQGKNTDSYINTTTWDFFSKATGSWVKLGTIKGNVGLTGAGYLSGTVNPLVGVGVNNDTYTNVVTGDVFFKTLGVWNKTGNLKGSPGIDGTNGNSLLSGTVNPTTQGLNGDTYINVTSSDVYSKSMSTWSKIGNIKGLPGVNGSSFLYGAVNPVIQGVDGDTYLNNFSYDLFNKSAGVWTKTGNIKGADAPASTGIILQSYYGQMGVVSGTTLITSKATVPLITEGTELWRSIFTAEELNSVLEIEFTGVCDSTRRNAKIFFVLFKDNNVVDWGAYSPNAANSGSPGPIAFRHISRITDLNPHTYVLRVGLDASGTWYIGRGNDKPNGDINESYFTFKEIRQ